MTTQPPNGIAKRFHGERFRKFMPEHRHLLERISDNEPISRNAAELGEVESTRWDRVADRMAAIGGSWGFILGFIAVLIGWIVVNTNLLPQWNAAFDPYPYIFLNLMMSMVAALQAPVILMSQNRQASKDRIAARNDYEVNLKAELEIMALHEKLDALRIDHLEMIVQSQSEMLELLKGQKPAAGT
jgi:uncharacterized membrane protein